MTETDLYIWLALFLISWLHFC